MSPRYHFSVHHILQSEFIEYIYILALTFVRFRFCFLCLQNILHNFAIRSFFYNQCIILINIKSICDFICRNIFKHCKFWFKVKIFKASLSTFSIFCVINNVTLMIVSDFFFLSGVGMTVDLGCLLIKFWIIRSLLYCLCVCVIPASDLQCFLSTINFCFICGSDRL